MCKGCKFLKFKDALSEVDYSVFRNLNEVVDYQMDLDKLNDLEYTYKDPDLIVSTPEFRYLYTKYQTILI